MITDAITIPFFLPSFLPFFLALLLLQPPHKHKHDTDEPTTHTTHTQHTREHSFLAETAGVSFFFRFVGAAGLMTNLVLRMLKSVLRCVGMLQEV